MNLSSSWWDWRYRVGVLALGLSGFLIGLLASDEAVGGFLLVASSTGLIIAFVVSSGYAGWKRRISSFLAVLVASTAVVAMMILGHNVR